MFWRRRYGWIGGRWRVLELVADNREAAPGKGARSLPTSLLRSSRSKRGQHDTSIERRTVATGGASWSGGSDPQDQPPPKTMYGGFCDDIHTPAAILDPVIVTKPYPTATHYRHAHIILESASPGQRGGSHSKQGCSTDERSVGGGYDRWQVF
jgi:hypothetical protein